jgi:hypothetical protein
MSICLLPESLDLDRILSELASPGATSVPLLPENLRLELLEEAKKHTYEPEPEEVGSGDRLVRQQMATIEDFPQGSLFLQLRDAIQETFDEGLVKVGPYPFTSIFQFNDLSLQKYRAGSLGITPHRDGLKFINLICIVVVGGQGRFFVCSDRSGNDSLEIDAEPGRAIFLRAPGFMGGNDRPFHYLTEVTEERYSFGLRQRKI